MFKKGDLIISNTSGITYEFIEDHPTYFVIKTIVHPALDPATETPANHTNFRLATKEEIASLISKKMVG